MSWQARQTFLHCESSEFLKAFSWVSTALSQWRNNCSLAWHLSYSCEKFAHVECRTVFKLNYSTMLMHNNAFSTILFDNIYINFHILLAFHTINNTDVQQKLLIKMNKKIPKHAREHPLHLEHWSSPTLNASPAWNVPLFKQEQRRVEQQPHTNAKHASVSNPVDCFMLTSAAEVAVPCTRKDIREPAASLI